MSPKAAESSAPRPRRARRPLRRRGLPVPPVSRRRIREFARRIAEEFRPERIILFGSRAHGRPAADSDVDLLVIMPHRGRPWRMAAEITDRLPPPFPLDLLVRSAAEVRRRVAQEDWFMREILDQGRVLYDAAGR